MNEINSHDDSALPLIISFADRLNSFTRATLNKELDSYGLKFNQWRLIHAISSKSIFTPAKLADELMIERATVSRYLDQLEDKECIRRSHNPFDRRVVDIELTSNGEQIAKFGVDLMDKAYKRVLTDLSAAENKNFVALIKKLSENIPTPRAQVPA
ncbi:MAG: MarR family transcriptional regulator [Gammaproteobacteria bacterium]|nr:MAG: MarR family transcriptional regulator [Gammaproteobacteria bacterium]